MTRFPDEFGHELAGCSFENVFISHPKWIECVRSCWTDQCTGFFLEFKRFVDTKLEDPSLVAEHEARCRIYVKSLESSKLPSYLKKYRP